MRILVVADFVRPEPWRAERWTPAIVHALRHRHHDVSLACPGAHDPDEFAPSRVYLHRPSSTRSQTRPLAFARWVRRLPVECDVTLSLSPFVAGDVWMPLGPMPRETLRWILRSPNVIRSGMELLSYPYLLSSALGQARAAASPIVRRRLTVGDAPLGFISLGHASAIHPPSAQAALDLRRRTRSILRIDPADRVLAVSCTHPERPGMDEFLRAFESLDFRDAGRLLIAGRAPYTAERACARARVLDRAIIVGPTARMDAILAAADAAVCAGSTRSPWTTARFAADALRMGVPVIARAGAPGADMIERHPQAGVIVRSADDWPDAIRSMLRERLTSARRAAAIAAESLSLDALVQRLEAQLIEVMREIAGSLQAGRAGRVQV